MEYNAKCPGIKRLLKELKDLQANPSPYFVAEPMEDNLFDWHFTIKGPEGTEFEGGKYHGRILLPTEYPFKPPNVMFLTPNGKFSLYTKICLNITGHHPETWRPAWSISTLLMGLISLFPTEFKGVGSMNVSPEKHMELAEKSKTWQCETCNVNMKQVEFVEKKEDEQISESDKSFLDNINWQYEKKEDEEIDEENQNDNEQNKVEEKENNSEENQKDSAQDKVEEKEDISNEVPKLNDEFVQNVMKEVIGRIDEKEKKEMEEKQEQKEINLAKLKHLNEIFKEHFQGVDLFEEDNQFELGSSNQNLNSEGNTTINNAPSNASLIIKTLLDALILFLLLGIVYKLKY